MSATLSILGTLTASLNLGRAILQRLRRPRSTPLQRAERAIHDARAASAQGDAAAVNAHAERDRVRRSLGVMAILLLLSGCGCATIRAILTPDPDATLPDLIPAVVVISADRYQYPMTNSAGVAGWFVPLAVHAEYCEAIVMLEYYRSMASTHKPPDNFKPTPDYAP
jgi:hypothetical protein